jgi:hypothetical protein
VNRTSTLLCAGALVGGLWACFDGRGTVGGICFADNQCGVDQRCTNSVCGLCGDGQIQPGELCLGNSEERNMSGQVADLVALDTIGVRPMYMAIVNTNCAPPPMRGPPPLEGSACWGLAFFIVADDGELDAEFLIEPYQDGSVPQMAVGNFDGSGSIDLAVVVKPNDPLATTSTLSVVHDFPGPEVTLNASLIPRTLHAADLNGDGLDDLIIGGQSSNTISLFLAAPGVGFETERLIVTDPAPRPAIPVDMDNDGDLDIVMLSVTNKTVGVSLNTGSGNFVPGPRLNIGDHLVPSEALTADFDFDGFVDVAVLASVEFGSSDKAEVQVYRGLGDGTLELIERLPGGIAPVSGVIADVNHDGWPDIVVADVGGDKLPVHINRGGRFPDFVRIDVGAAPRTLMVEDIDEDGIPDIAIGNANGVIAVVFARN